MTKYLMNTLKITGQFARYLNERGVQPERLPPAEDVRKVQRKLQSDERSVAKQVKKNNKKK